MYPLKKLAHRRRANGDSELQLTDFLTPSSAPVGDRSEADQNLRGRR